MNENAIKEVVGVICESCREGDYVSVAIDTKTDGSASLIISNAPSYVMDAITDNGYHIKAEFGSVFVMAEEG